VGLDERGCHFWLDPIETAGTKKEGLYPVRESAKAKAGGQGASESCLECRVVDCQASGGCVSDKKNCAKSQNTWEQVALACIDQKSLAIAR